MPLRALTYFITKVSHRIVVKHMESISCSPHILHTIRTLKHPQKLNVHTVHSVNRLKSGYLVESFDKKRVANKARTIRVHHISQFSGRLNIVCMYVLLNAGCLVIAGWLAYYYYQLLIIHSLEYWKLPKCQKDKSIKSNQFLAERRTSTVLCVWSSFHSILIS